MTSPHYHSKLCTADEAVQAIQSHDRVFMTGNCSVPKELLGALVRRAPELEDVEIVQVLTIGPAEYVAPEMAGPHPGQLALHQPQRAQGGQRGPRRFHADLPQPDPAGAARPEACCARTSP